MNKEISNYSYTNGVILAHKLRYLVLNAAPISGSDHAGGGSPQYLGVGELRVGDGEDGSSGGGGQERVAGAHHGGRGRQVVGH